MPQLKIGCDPEVFAIYNVESLPELGDELLNDPQFVASPAVLMKFHGVPQIGGDDKHPVLIDNPFYRWIMDGAAFELNLKEPQDNPETMWEIAQSSLKDLEKWLCNYGFELRKKPVVNFDYEKWGTPELIRDERFQQGIIFGCDPDLDAFNVDWLCRILDNSKHPLRYGGGHFHFSGIPEFEKYPLPSIKILAVTLGNYVNSMSPYPDLEKARAKYYGKPGKYRVQKYKEGVGIEYRTPSNSWLSYSKKQYMKIWDWVDMAIGLISNPKAGKQILEEYEIRTINAITKSDQSMSKQILGEIC